ncbi:type II-A CRISPR-associated protein Csn2 [Gemella sanguinis]|uniref:type II-A CRISPR-associated protein Csn2 n=1 Tax=Gemella sanguinis TaxID=84135 RepID=UPI0026F2A9E9|nr:type II-A CRISPR-associated protein Csn2 [Gemella sanguinis]
MKIINNNWQRQIVLEDNLIHTIVFENKKYYRENILELIRQHKGYEGNFILSNNNNNKEVSFDKNSYFISDLFNIDINNKKIITKVYGELLKIVTDDIAEYNKITSYIREYFETLVFNNNLDLEYNDEIEANSLLKLGDFKIQFEENDYLEKLIKFLKVLVELCNIKVIFTVGLYRVFSVEEVEKIYKEVCLNKINIINIESEQQNIKKSDCYKEIVYIFDLDNCEI